MEPMCGDDNEGDLGLITMLVYSFVIGYFLSMTILVYNPSDVTNNINKFNIALLMATFMGAYHEGYMMLCRYTGYNFILLILFVLASIILLNTIQQQYGVNQDQFISSMIEHHSTALTMASRVIPKATDPRIKSMAENIMKSQQNEIDMMKTILETPYSTKS